MFSEFSYAQTLALGPKITVATLPELVLPRHHVFSLCLTRTSRYRRPTIPGALLRCDLDQLLQQENNNVCL